MSLHNPLFVSPDLLKNVAHIPLVSIKPFTEEITPGVFLCSELLGPNIRKRASSSLGIFGIFAKMQRCQRCKDAKDAKMPHLWKAGYTFFERCLTSFKDAHLIFE